MDNTNGNAGILSSLSNQLADAVERIGPAVVTVYGRQRLPSSGVVYKQGLVLTAEHAIEREEDLSIATHDGRKLPAQFVGRDPSSDLAVLRVDDLNVEPAQGSGEPRVGQLVLAVARPSEDGPMASQGIVSAVGGPVRTGRGGMLEKYIRTDATPYPGFSGGPLIDTTGAVLGILTTGLAGGVALAVPTSIAWRVADTLTAHGRIKRGYLGISSQPVYLPEAQRAGREQETGLMLVRVDKDTPAEQGGLLLGDILVALDGQPVNDVDDLQALLSGDRVGNPVPVEVIRGGQVQTLTVTIGQRD
ncbi:MAG: S1C family serine protease [Chloroflexota bacterium]|nr:S1C family serine protease [Chloroflexota bacterium]MDQ5865813.1 S1C family serine protease [Chloroflexota bacterium]